MIRRLADRRILLQRAPACGSRSNPPSASTTLKPVDQRPSQQIKELAERYESNLSDISSRVDEYEKKVQEHLKKMGFN